VKIGKLATLNGCSVQAIRHYEKEGLLVSSGRSEGNFRLYDESAIEQLMFIKHCRTLDLTLEEITQLVELNRSPGKECDSVNQMSDRKIEQEERRTRELKKLQRQLKILRDSCSSSRTIGQCGILQKWSKGS